ncbi:DUF3037 domain-containing protein [Belliella kenyensis]|uniref:DUF3037 domain-containing protein n=1 Tax=Belliella kenyensis TaxID=1472724 RepID=A0ABV8EIR6_9BACT|nr:DUF3037 domain-containing protein [Belliella kenyensis]MCH7403499.1 DUF3037 domain-containing protein [Belliella kenyensis]MDN3602398.1 DUF3037 domain-containing protein [Belliella kenyensis]
MQGKHLYEYAILRIVPRVEREEFVNVGVLICCKREGYLSCKLTADLSKVQALDKDADLQIFDQYLKSIEAICQGRVSESPIARHDAPSRFRWLTANRSSMIQTSRPHIGFSDELQSTLNELFELFVA